MLTGEYRNTLDEKGRILFPAKLRAEIEGNVLFITQGIDGCLWLFSPEEWNKLSEKIMENASIFNAHSRSVLRRLVAPSQEVEFDKAGRIMIPQSLREYSEIKRDCVILGVNKYMELWDADKYSEYLANSAAEFENSTEELSGICF